MCFWLSVSDNWVFSEKFKQKCEQTAFQVGLKIIEKNKEIFLSLKPKLHETEDNVINDLVEQIEKYYYKNS